MTPILDASRPPCAGLWSFDEDLLVMPRGISAKLVDGARVSGQGAKNGWGWDPEAVSWQTLMCDSYFGKDWDRGSGIGKNVGGANDEDVYTYV